MRCGAVGSQAMVFLPERFLGFNVLRVDRNARHGAHLYALRLIKMAYTFRAFGRVDLVDVFAQIDSLVRAFGLAHIAVNAFVGNQQCHGGVLQV
jgi:hypothetical protein